MKNYLLFSLVFLGLSSFGLTDKYDDWLEKEVNWIISEKEREEFKKLKTDEEKEAFIERFWERRDPTPGTLKNEYREEHYRRLQYVAENFKEGIPGHRTDRGRVYIIHGPPVSTSQSIDQILWTYNHNPYAQYYKGAVTLVFERGGDVFQNRDLSEGPRQATVAPGQVPDFLNQRPRVSARYRLINAHAGTTSSGGTSVGDTDRYIGDILRSPGEVLEERAADEKRRKEAMDRARETIKSNVTFESIPLFLNAVTVLSKGDGLVTFATGVPAEELVLQEEEEGLRTARLDVLCEVLEPASNYQIDRVDETVPVVIQDGLVLDDRYRVRYGNRFNLPPGEYTLRCIARQVETEKMGTSSQAIQISPPSSNTLELSDLLFTDLVVSAEPQSSDPFSFADLRLEPVMTQTFTQNSRPALFFHIYNFQKDGQPRDLYWDYQIFNDQGVARRASMKKADVVLARDNYLPVGWTVSLTDLEPGTYTLMVKVLDDASKQYSIAKTEFEVVAPAVADPPTTLQKEKPESEPET